MRSVSRTWVVLVAALSVGALPGCNSSGGGATPAATSGAGGSTTGGTTGGATGGGATGSQPTAPSLATIVQEAEARRLDYLAHAAAGGGFYAQISKLALNRGPIDEQPIRDALVFIDGRPDTADFKLTRVTPILLRWASSPLVSASLTRRIEQTVLGFKYSIDEPGTDGMVFWSENHQIMFATAAYLLGDHLAQRTFTNSGLTGAQLAARAKPKIERWLEHRWQFGFSEWNSPVYYPHDVAPLVNLIDFAPDPAIRARAAMVLDLLLFDLARLSNRGSFGVTAGRIYEEHKISGHRESIGDLAEILFGQRGAWRGRGSTAGTSFAASSYRVPHALLAVGRDTPDRLVDRARNGIDFRDGAQYGIGFQSLDDGLVWWGMGGYMAPQTIQLSLRMINAWDLWSYPAFDLLKPIRSVPGFLLPALSSTLSPVSEGSLLSRANVYTFRSPDAMLSSVQSYRKGQVGYQQHAWQATLDLDARVFTTAPGNLGRNGPDHWTGSASMPRVVQVEDALIALYNPPLSQRALFAPATHAFFPEAAFDEVRVDGPWVFGRKGTGYVGLYSALPLQRVQTGAWVGQELTASGYRNAFVCVVGRAAEDGTFTQFGDRLRTSRVQVAGAGGAAYTAAFDVVFDAPGIGELRVNWTDAPTLGGGPIPIGNFPRYDNPYSQTPWDSPTVTIQHRGASLQHDFGLGVRAGAGL